MRRVQANIPAVVYGRKFVDLPAFLPDPILELNREFAADRVRQKVNLGIGVFRNKDGRPVLLDAVRRANIEVQETDMEYAAISGVPEFVDKAQALAFGDEFKNSNVKRLASVQTLSCTGALHLGLRFMKTFHHTDHIWVPDPTWANHSPMARGASLQLYHYAYLDYNTKQLNFPAMMEDLSIAPPHTIILLHACAHNPTGVDPSEEQWKEIVSVIKKRKLFPFVDMAYQGFATGDLDKDAFAARLIAAECPNSILCQSFSKNFGLYGHRTGALHLLCKDDNEQQRVLSQLKLIARANYSSPPVYGARIVNTVLSNLELRSMWENQLIHEAQMLRDIRVQLVEYLKQEGSVLDWSHITKHVGMMSWTGLQKPQVERLRKQFSIYMTDDGRMSVAGLHKDNVKLVAQSLHMVTK